MNENDQIPEPQQPLPEGQHPLQRIITIAAVACFASSLGFYLISRHEVSQLQVWWAELLVYAAVPIAVTFIVLYRSDWHREITGAARTCSLLLLSGVILGGEMIVAVVTLGVAVMFICAGLFGVGAVSGGNH
jgi:hypothetical protein